MHKKIIEKWRILSEQWEARIDAFWNQANDDSPEDLLQQMRVLVKELPDDSPEAIYEWASVHDFLGMEDAAIPIYRQSLELGLTEPRRSQAIIQLASSLRNVGNSAEAITVLSKIDSASELRSAAQAFLALAQYDNGQPQQALQSALLALAPTLPLYSRAIAEYAKNLKPEL